MGWLKRLLLHNWWLKLLSLALAYALWAIVTQAPPVEMRVSVPVEVAHVPAGLTVAEQTPARVELQLRGSESLLRRLDPEEVGVVLDLSQATAGNQEFRLAAGNVDVPPGIEVLRIVPAEVRLVLTPR